MSAAPVELRSVDKVYDSGAHAVRALDLTVDAGELLVVLGPSGCGKSTLLRLVAGLEAVTSGEIHVGGRRVDHEPPQRRDVAMVFQSYALYGHMTVRRNLEFPLRLRGVAATQRGRRVAEVAELLELGDLLDQKPATLSGGQQQRVAMGRALVREPSAFLLDEPLSNLDARLRAQVRTHIAEIQRRLGVTTLHVTHDQVEALSLGHRVAVLRDGRLQQVAPGQELYDRPANAFVAQFLGRPGMNLIAARLRRSDSGLRARVGSTELPIDGALGVADDDLARHLGHDVFVGVRPEALDIEPAGGEAERRDGGGDGGIPGEIQGVEELGSERIVRVRAPDLDILDATAAVTGEGVGARVDRTLAVRVRGGERGVGPGDRVVVRFPSERLHLFDADGRTLQR